MSFSKTVEQMRNRTKTVTRRRVGSWKNLKPGDRLLAIEKGMGLALGEKQVPIGVIEIVSVQVQSLDELLSDQRPDLWLDNRREGFPYLTLRGFVKFFGREFGMDRTELVRRIEFRHVDGEVAS